MKYYPLFMLLLAGCSSYEMQRDRNNSNLLKVSQGDTKAQVVAICGDPGKFEQFSKGDTPYEILFYYTAQIGDKSWETGHTPILVRNGKVIGIGWRALRANGIDSSDLSVEVKPR